MREDLAKQFVPWVVLSFYNLAQYFNQSILQTGQYNYYIVYLFPKFNKWGILGENVKNTFTKIKRFFC